MKKLSAKFGLQLHINLNRIDIATDWNFVMASAGAKYVTIAHQDDIYDSEYLKVMGSLAVRYPKLQLAFSNYREHTESKPRPPNINLKIKHHLCKRAFGESETISRNDIKRRLLNMGNPICCPSVMINRETNAHFRFDGAWKTNLDWDAWLRLAAEPGDFAYSDKKLVSKRVHPGSETSVTIATRVRQNEDKKMFQRFWPKPVAALITAVYSAGYMANRVR